MICDLQPELGLGSAPGGAADDGAVAAPLASRQHRPTAAKMRAPAKTIPERFADWKQTPGGAQVLCRAYRIAAMYYGRFKRTKRGVSQRLIWETLRDRIDGIRKELGRRGITLERENGFYLNDHFTAHMVRHMIEHHPEWGPMFELREIGKCRRPVIAHATGAEDATGDSQLG